MFKKIYLSIPLLIFSVISTESSTHAQIKNYCTETNQIEFMDKQKEQNQASDNIVSLNEEIKESEFEKQKEKNQIESVLKTVLDIYKSILDLDLKYDWHFRDENNDENYENNGPVEFLYSDCEYLEKNKRGVCRHFSNYLIKKFRDAGIEAYPLYIDYNSKIGHQAVLYKIDDELFVADITSDIISINNGNTMLKEKPLFYADGLENFIDEMKEDHGDDLAAIAYLNIDLTDYNSKLSVDDIVSKLNFLYKQ